MPDLDFTGVDPADYIDATWDDQNGKPWRAHANGMWYEYVEPVTGGTTTFAELTDAATVDLPALNTPLAAALAGKQATLTSGTTLKTVNGDSLLGAGNLTISSNLTSGPVTSSGGVSAIADGVLSIAKTSGLQTALDTKLASTTAATTYAPIRRLLTGVGPHTAAVGDRITLDNTSTVAQINDPTTTPTGGALTAGMMFTVIIQRGTMWFNGTGQVFAASRLELVRAYNGAAWSTLGSVVSDTLTVGALTSSGAISGTTGTFSGAVSSTRFNAATFGDINGAAFSSIFGMLRYTGGGTNRMFFGASDDIAIGRASPGVMEVTNGTGGVYRDWLLRNLTASGTVTAAAISGTTGTFSGNGAASAPAVNITGIPFAGTGTTSFPLVYLNETGATPSTTLSTAGTLFGVNGNGNADLINLLKDGASMFSVGSNGNVFASGFIRGSYFRFTGGTGEAKIYKGSSDGVLTFYNQSEASSITLDFNTSGTLKIRNNNNSADSALTCSNLTASGTVTAACYIEGVSSLGTVVSAATITITGGSSVTAQLTASTACTFTLPTAAAGLSFVLHLKQAAATGNGSATFTGVIWSGGTAPTITPTAGRMDILSFITGPNAAGNGWQWFGSVIPNVLPS